MQLRTLVTTEKPQRNQLQSLPNTTTYFVLSCKVVYRGWLICSPTKPLKAAVDFRSQNETFAAKGFTIITTKGPRTTYYGCPSRINDRTDTMIQERGSSKEHNSDVEFREAVWLARVGNHTPTGGHVPDVSFNELVTQSTDLRIAGKKLQDAFPRNRAVSDKPELA